MKKNRRIFALVPFVLILLFIIIFYLNGGLHLFNFERIQELHLKWRDFATERPLLSAVYFIGIYIVSVTLVIPDSTFLSLLAGFLFPMPLAIAYVCISETIGATIFFLAFRLAFTGTINRENKGILHKMQIKIKNDEACYLLFLRFSHILPFWLVDVGAGLFRIKSFTFIWTTFVGVIPLAFFLVDSGESLSKYFETHTHFVLKELFTTQFKIAMLGLACLALLPILYKKYISKKK